MYNAIHQAIVKIHDATTRLCTGGIVDDTIYLSELNCQLALEIPFITRDERYIPIYEFNKIITLLKTYDINCDEIKQDYMRALDHLSICFQCIQARSEGQNTEIEIAYSELKQSILSQVHVDPPPPFKEVKKSTYYQKALALSESLEINRYQLPAFFKEIMHQRVYGNCYSLDCLSPLLKKAKDDIDVLIELLNTLILSLQKLLFYKKNISDAYQLLEIMPELFGLIEKYAGTSALESISEHITQLRPVDDPAGQYIYFKFTVMLSVYTNHFSYYKHPDFDLSSQNQQGYYDSLGKDLLAIESPELYQPLDKLAGLHVPYLIKRMIISHGDECVLEFIKFYHLVEKQNIKADFNHRVNLFTSFFKNQYKLGLLLNIYQSAYVFKLLSNKIVHSNNTLFRFLKEIPIVNSECYQVLGDVFRLFLSSYQSSKKKGSIDNLVTLSFLIYRLANDESSDLDLMVYQKALPTLFEGDVSHIEILLKEYLFDLLLKKLDISKENVPGSIKLSMLEMETLKATVNGITNMSQSYYNSVYIKQLRLQLTGGSFQSFAHDVTQKDELGQTVSVHNQKTRERMLALSLDPKTVVEYNESKSLVYNGSEENRGQAYHALYHVWIRLVSLEGFISSLQGQDPRTDQAIRRYIKNIAQIKKRLTRCGRPVEYINALQKAGVMMDIKDAYKIVEVLFNKELKMSREVQDEMSHAIRLYHDFQETYKTLMFSSVNKNQMPLHFEVKMKDKSEWDTLQLGDEMACCMSTVGESFKALVLTRVHDDMPIIVITDIITQKPAGLIWLYIAIKDNQKPCLVGEYLEVNNKYRAPPLMKALNHALISFCHEYYEAIGGLDGFYLGDHFYGVTKGAVSHYPKGKMVLHDLCGGMLVTKALLEEDVLPNTLKERKHFYSSDYMLLNFSPTNEEAHIFNKDILDAEKVPGLYELGPFIQSLAKEGVGKGYSSIVDIKDYILNQAAFILAPYFKDNLLKDKKFEILLRQSLRHIEASDPSKPQKSLSSPPTESSPAILLSQYGHYQTPKVDMDPSISEVHDLTSSL